MQDIFTDPRADEIFAIITKETSVPRAALVPGATLEALGIPSLDVMLVLVLLLFAMKLEAAKQKTFGTWLRA